jgi:uncharacterized protein YbjT (DUF2867 family)
MMSLGILKFSLDTLHFSLNPFARNVQALVRSADPEILETLPRSVQVAVGDVGEPSTLKAAVEGCNKIIFCARARSNLTGDLNRVDRLGVYNLAKAFQVLVFPFLSPQC